MTRLGARLPFALLALSKTRISVPLATKRRLPAASSTMAAAAELGRVPLPEITRSIGTGSPRAGGALLNDSMARLPLSSQNITLGPGGFGLSVLLLHEPSSVAAASNARHK